MKIASFNVNGIKARLPIVLDWLRDSQPDVAILQEIKSTDENFPCEPIADLGYNAYTYGQKSFNGVALLSKSPLEDVQTGLAGDDSDEQARYIEGTCIGAKRAVRICGLYLPNGNPAPGPKYDYKLAWMARLKARAQALLAADTPFLMAGDYNIIPQTKDCWDTEPWQNDALYLLESRTAYRELLNLGLTDAFRACNQQAMQYTFWDFQGGAWSKNNGIRIDHFLLSCAVADDLLECQIERDLRGCERPSDHVPIWVELDC